MSEPRGPEPTRPARPAEPLPSSPGPRPERTRLDLLAARGPALLLEDVHRAVPANGRLSPVVAAFDSSI